MPQWFREFLAPIVDWTVAFTAVGAGIGAAGALSGGAPLAAAPVLGLFLGAAGLTCGLAYSAVVLRGRRPRMLTMVPTAIAGAVVGVLPVVVLALAAVQEGATFQNGVRDGLAMAALGAATAAFVRWRDRRRALAESAEEYHVAEARAPEATTAPSELPFPPLSPPHTHAQASRTDPRRTHP